MNNSFYPIETCPVALSPVFPREMALSPEKGGIVFGCQDGNLIGLPFREEGNILLIGGPGSGKSTNIIMPTLSIWNGPFVAIDIKGELAKEFSLSSHNKRKIVILNPDNPGSLSVDPFEWLDLDGKENLLSNITAFASILTPETYHTQDPFWEQSERSVLIAALLCYFQANLSFPQAIIRILDLSLPELCKELKSFSDPHVNFLVGSFEKMREETVASIERGLKNKLLLFANEEKLLHFFRGKRENAPTFSLEELEDSVVFIQIPLGKIDQWGAGIALLLSMILKHLELRPEKFSPEAESIDPFLFAIDEFPRFKRLPMISSALATLRSKSVNLLLAVQSLTQLESIYGEQERASIMDCCSYQVILNVADPKNQRIIADAVGENIVYWPGFSTSYNKYGFVNGYSEQIAVQRQYAIQPFDLKYLKGVIALTPNGSYFIQKFVPCRALAYDTPKKGIQKPSVNICLLQSRLAESSIRVKTYLEHLSNVQEHTPEEIALNLGKMLQKRFPDYLLPETDTKQLDHILCFFAADHKALDEIKKKAEEKFNQIS